MFLTSFLHEFTCLFTGLTYFEASYIKFYTVITTWVHSDDSALLVKKKIGLIARDREVRLREASHESILSTRNFTWTFFWGSSAPAP